MHLFYSRLRYYFGSEATKTITFGPGWSLIRFTSDPCTDGHLPFDLYFSYNCCTDDSRNPKFILTVSIWEKERSGAYFEMIREQREVIFRNPQCDEYGNLTDPTADLFFLSTFCRKPDKFIPKGSITCEPSLPDRFEAYDLFNVLNYFWIVLCDEDTRAEDFSQNLLIALKDCLKPCEEDEEEEDCPSESNDCEDYEERCPDPVTLDGYCGIYATSVFRVGNLVTGRGFYEGPRKLYYQRQYNGESDAFFCAPYTDGEGSVERPYRTFTIPPFNTGDPYTDAVLTLNEFQRLYTEGNCGLDDEEEEEPDENNNRDEEQRCGFYLIFEISAGVRFEYEVPGQEDVVLTSLQLISYEFEVPTPIQLTASEFRLVNLVDPDFEISADLDGITVGLAFELALGPITVSNSRFNLNYEFQWAALCPPLAPILAGLATQPLTPWLSVKWVGTGRRNC